MRRQHFAMLISPLYFSDMPTHKIIYPAADGSVAVVVPADDMLPLSVALKDVPAGLPFLILPADEVPPSDSRAGWTPSFAEPDGHGLGHDAWVDSGTQL